MAAVTVATGYPRLLVNGNYREWLYKFNTAANADYLDVPLHSVWGINLNDNAVTAMGITSTTLTNGKVRVVFSCGVNTNVFCRVIGQ